MDYQLCSSCGDKGHLRQVTCPRCDGLGRLRIPLRPIAIMKEKRAKG